MAGRKIGERMTWGKWRGDRRCHVLHPEGLLRLMGVQGTLATHLVDLMPDCCWGSSPALNQPGKKCSFSLILLCRNIVFSSYLYVPDN